MYKLIKALSLSILLSISIFAQTSTNNNVTANNSADADPVKPVSAPNAAASGSVYNKNEYYIGYSNQQIDVFDRRTFHGFEGSYTRNVSRWIGIRGSISGAYQNKRYNGLTNIGTTQNTFTIDLNNRVYNFLGGVQIKDNASTKRFKPFAFALGGVAVNNNRTFTTTCQTSACTTANVQVFKYSDTGLSGVFGGGLDIKINSKIDFRAIQFDYNPIYSNSRVDNNFRFGVGFVFK